MALHMSYAIQASVGEWPWAANNRADVEAIQVLLNEHAARLGYAKLPVNGMVSPQMIQDIRTFQEKVVGMKMPDGRVDPNGATLRHLNAPVGAPPPPAFQPKYVDVFSHPDADKVKLTYGIQGDGQPVVPLNAKAEYLLKSILASCGMTGAQLNSTLRTYHDQARITLTQTYPSAGGPDKVKQWYGQEVLDACKKYGTDVAGMEAWWKEHDRKRGKESSKHLSNRAMDVVPSGDRAKFAAKVQELVPVPGSGVRRIIPKGVMNEPVDHVEFTFAVTG
jgi:hypothetical protein